MMHDKREPGIVFFQSRLPSSPLVVSILTIQLETLTVKAIQYHKRTRQTIPLPFDACYAATAAGAA